MIFRLVSVPLAFAAWVLASAVSCAEGNEGAQSLGAHEHGRGQLNVVIDGARLEAELIVSADDVLGFEHVAQSSEELAIKKKVAALLKDGLAILGPSAGASCESVSSEVVFDADRAGRAGETPVAEEHSEHGHDDSGHGHDDHSDEKDDDAHGGLGEGENHSEVHATYSMRCSNMAKLDMLALTYFDAFERAQSLWVNVVNDRSQFRTDVSRAKPEVGVVARQ